MKQQIRQAYIKIYDKINDEYLYKNKITGDISSRKPVFLGKEDLPDPKQYEAPFNYDPEYMDEEAFAMLITVTAFNSDRIPELPVQYIKDHNAIDALLPHRYHKLTTSDSVQHIHTKVTNICNCIQ